MDKFEKWSEESKNKFIKEFIKELNQTHQTDFVITKDSLIDNQDYDFSLCQGKKILKVQHTFMYLKDKEYIKDKNINELINQTQKELEGLKGIFIFVNFNKLPITRENTHKLVHFLSSYIKLIVKENNNTLFRYIARDEVYLKIIKQWVDWLEIKSINHPRFVLAYGSHNYNDCVIMWDTERIKMTLSKKSKYSNPEDLVLLIHNNSKFPVEDMFFDPIIKLCSNEKFQEIWLYDDNGKKFIQLKR